MSDPNEYVRPDTPEGIIMHHMGNGLRSPCLLQPADVYSGLQAGFTTDWSDVDCPACLEAKPGGLVDQIAPMPSFYVSFGIDYATTPHPYWPGAHPDGYLEVVATDEEAARLLVRSYIGLKWGHMYDRKPEWARRGALAMVSAGYVWSAPGVQAPTPQFTEQDPQYWGHEPTELVAARIEGELLEDSDQDALDNLGYEAEYVHRGCLTQGLAMFREVTDVDSRVQAGELDWSEQGQYVCAVCEQAIL